MNVGHEETIAGVRLMKVREFLRWTGDCSVQLDAIKERFCCDQANAEQIEKALIDAMYIEEDPNMAIALQRKHSGVDLDRTRRST
jgi:hypothetical protein